MSVECIGYRAHESGSLQGFADLRLPTMGVELYGCGLFMKNGKRWVSLPSKEYDDKETGERKYQRIMKFMAKEHSDLFSTAALPAIDKWCESQIPVYPEPIQQEALPF